MEEKIFGKVTSLAATDKLYVIIGGVTKSIDFADLLKAVKKDGAAKITADQISNLPAQNLPDATVQTKGVAKLSYRAKTITNPIVLGKNDPTLPYFALIYG